MKQAMKPRRQPSTPDLMSGPDLCRDLGIDRQKLTLMTQAGLPIAERRKSRRGSPTQFFDRQAVRAWMLANSNLGIVRDLAMEIGERMVKQLRVPRMVEGPPTPAAPLADAAPPPAASVDEGQPAQLRDWQTQTERMNQLFHVEFGQLAKLTKQHHATENIEELQALTRLIGYQSKVVRDTYEVLRRGSKDSAKILLSLGDVVRRDVAEREMCEMARVIAHELDSLPNKAAPRLVKLTATQAHKVLMEEVQEIKRLLAQGG